MHFTLAGILALATAVAATPVAPPVWHATPDIDVTQLEQRCGDLNVYCCNNFGNGNGNSGLAAAGLTEEIITALGGALGFIPGANTACAPANVNSGAITETVTGTLAGLLGLPSTPQNFCGGEVTYACCPGNGGECNAISVTPTVPSGSM